MKVIGHHFLKPSSYPLQVHWPLFLQPFWHWAPTSSCLLLQFPLPSWKHVNYSKEKLSPMSLEHPFLPTTTTEQGHLDARGRITLELRYTWSFPPDTFLFCCKLKILAKKNLLCHPTGVVAKNLTSSKDNLLFYLWLWSSHKSNGYCTVGGIGTHCKAGYCL